MLLDAGSGWKVLEVSEGGLFLIESWMVLKSQGRSWKTRRSFQFSPNLDQHTPLAWFKKACISSENELRQPGKLKVVMQA